MIEGMTAMIKINKKRMRSLFPPMVVAAPTVWRAIIPRSLRYAISKVAASAAFGPRTESGRISYASMGSDQGRK